MIVLTSSKIAPRFLVASAAFALMAFGLSACGRRGPLELPPDVQARGFQAQAEAESRHPGPVNAVGEPTQTPPPPPIPGTVGNRPPAEYPFLLDPLL
jgi:predicted small lipoprotein YifL